MPSPPLKPTISVWNAWNPESPNRYRKLLCAGTLAWPVCSELEGRARSDGALASSHPHRLLRGLRFPRFPERCVFSSRSGRWYTCITCEVE